MGSTVLKDGRLPGICSGQRHESRRLRKHWRLSELGDLWPVSKLMTLLFEAPHNVFRDKLRVYFKTPERSGGDHLGLSFVTKKYEFRTPPD